jgi:hypothetical protein
MCCMVWDKEDDTFSWSVGMRFLQLKHQSERPLCNKRKLVIETVNGEIYGSSC